MLEVAEIFNSLQGEGPLAGHPAVFLRLAGCPQPHCKWCDTPMALSQGQLLSVAAIAKRLDDAPMPLVVITGGEPFLQWRQGLQTLVQTLLDSGRRIQFETSGKAGIPASCGGMVVCSPKPMECPQLNPADVQRVDIFKMVVQREIEPVLDFQKQYKIAADRIWLMPKGRTRDQQLAAMQHVWSLCEKYGFRFAARLQVLAFDDQGGR